MTLTDKNRYKLPRNLPHVGMEPGSKVIIVMGMADNFYPVIMRKHSGIGMGFQGADIGPFWEVHHSYPLNFATIEQARSAAADWAEEEGLTYVETL